MLNLGIAALKDCAGFCVHRRHVALRTQVCVEGGAIVHFAARFDLRRVNAGTLGLTPRPLVGLDCISNAALGTFQLLQAFGLGVKRIEFRHRLVVLRFQFGSAGCVFFCRRLVKQRAGFGGGVRHLLPQFLQSCHDRLLLGETDAITAFGPDLAQGSGYGRLTARAQLKDAANLHFKGAALVRYVRPDYFRTRCLKTAQGDLGPAIGWRGHY